MVSRETRARLLTSADVEVTSLRLHVVERLVLEWLVELSDSRVEVPDRSVPRTDNLCVFEGALREVPFFMLADRTDPVILPIHVDEEDLPPAGFDGLHRPRRKLRSFECPGEPLHRMEAWEE